VVQLVGESKSLSPDLKVNESQKENTGNQLIILENRQSFDRQDEIISIKKDKLKRPTQHLFPLIKDGSQTLNSQLSDSDADGTWDRLLISVSLKAHQKDTLWISWVPKNQLPVFKKATNIRFSYKSKTGKPTPEIKKLMRLRGFTQDISNPVFQLEGPGIENDKVAFRVFFDKRNSKDIYGKLTSKMVLDKVGLTGSWHKLQNWGMDILHTGESIGAGGLAVKEGGIVYPLADADSSFYTMVEEGPLRASLNLRFVNWDTGTLKTNGSETISMKKGDFFYQDEVRVPLTDKQELVCGMPNFHADSLVFIRHNKKFSSISTYSKQAEGTSTSLGLAIMFPTKEYEGKYSSKAGSLIDHSYYVAMSPTKNAIQKLYFFACWELTDKRFTTRHGFHQYLQETADRLANPIKVTIINY